jgi:hypothetical protein
MHKFNIIYTVETRRVIGAVFVSEGRAGEDEQEKNVRSET